MQARVPGPGQAAAVRAGFALLEQFAWPIALFVCLPLLIAQLGTAQFGLLSLALTVCGLSSLLAIGVGATTTRNVLVATEMNDPALALRSVRSAFGAVILLGGAICAAIGFATPMLAATLFAKLQPGELTAAALLAGLACALMQEIDTVFSMALKGRDRFALAAMLEWTGRGFWAATAIGAVMWGGLVWLLVTTVMAMLFKCVLKAVAAAIVFGAVVLQPLVSQRAIRPLISASRWLWIQNLSALLLLSADRLAIGALFGSEAIGRYTACAQLAQFAFIVPAAAGQALLPWAARHLRNGTEPRFGWGASLPLLGLASSLGGIAMAILSYPILSAWLGPAFAEHNAALLSALAMAAAVLSFSVPYHFVQLAAGRVRRIGILNALGAATCVAACLAAAPFGVVAFALAKMAYAVPLLAYMFQPPESRNVDVQSDLARSHAEI